MDATNVAAAGIGSPLNFPFSTVWTWTLYRASRGDPAVQAVQHHPRDDGRGGPLELAGIRRGDRVKPGKQRSRRDQIGQYVDPPADPVLPSDPLSHDKTPTTLSPARTRSPTLTLI